MRTLMLITIISNIKSKETRDSNRAGPNRVKYFGTKNKLNLWNASEVQRSQRKKKENTQQESCSKGQKVSAHPVHAYSKRKRQLLCIYGQTQECSCHYMCKKLRNKVEQKFQLREKEGSPNKRATKHAVTKQFSKTFCSCSLWVRFRIKSKRRCWSLFLNSKWKFSLFKSEASHSFIFIWNKKWVIKTCRRYW